MDWGNNHVITTTNESENVIWSCSSRSRHLETTCYTGPVSPQGKLFAIRLRDSSVKGLVNFKMIAVSTLIYDLGFYGSIFRDSTAQWDVYRIPILCKVKWISLMCFLELFRIIWYCNVIIRPFCTNLCEHRTTWRRSVYSTLFFLPNSNHCVK